MTKTKKVVLSVIAAVMAVALTVGAILLFKKDSSMFAGESVAIVLESDYKLTDKDVNATGGQNKTVIANGADFTIDLGGKVLDLNGYTLKISSDAQGAEVTFKTGIVKNGVLDISVPNGDINFNGAELAQDVTYELEAASDTIHFSNVVVRGSGKVKSDTHIKIEHSEMGDISLEGSGSLEAGEGTTLGNLNLGENASGAKVVVSQDATVSSVAIGAKAEIQIAGTVATVTVKENATDSQEIKVNVQPSAKVETVEVKAAAKVEVAGEVSSVVVADTATNGTNNAEVAVKETAKVETVEVKAAAKVEVAGEVSAVVVAETANNGATKVEVAVKETAKVETVEVKAAAKVEVAGEVSSVVVAETAISQEDKVEVEVKNTADVKNVDLKAKTDLSIQGVVSNMVVSEQASGTKVEVKGEHATAGRVVIDAEVTVDADQNTLQNVVVSTQAMEKVEGLEEVEVETQDDVTELVKPHTYVASDDKIDATCVSEGSVTYECSECGDSYSMNVPKKPHKLGDYESLNDATCTEDGHKNQKCVNCDYETAPILDEGSKLGHDWSEYVSNEDATCLADGTKTRICERCDQPETVIDEGSKLPHSFTDYVDNDDATCTADGTETALCDTPGCFAEDTRVKVGTKLPHTFNENAYVSDDNATCTEDGTKTAKCANCDATDTKVEANTKKGHSFVTYVPNNDATCIKDATETATCDTDGCNEKDTRSIPNSKGQHVYTDYISNKDGTCTVNGTETAMCDTEGCYETHTRTQENSKKPHTFTNYVPNGDGTETAKCDNCEATDRRDIPNHDCTFANYVSNNDADCENNATETGRCTYSGCVRTHTREIPNSGLGHKFTNYVSNNDATCLVDGTKTAKCNNCTKTDTQADTGSKLDHTYNTYVYNDDATCTEDGTETATCDTDGCDEKHTRTKANTKAEHSFTNYVSNNDATCAKDGTKTAKCDNCEATDRKTDANTKLEHSFSQYVLNADGITETAKCDNKGCNEIHTRNADAHEHVFETYVYNNDATYFEDGTKTAKCKVDGCLETKTVIAENTALDFSSKSLYNILCLVVGDGTYSVNVKEGSSILAFTDWSIEDRYNKDTLSYVELHILSAALKVVDGEPSGTFKVSVKVYTYEFEGSGSMMNVDLEKLKEDARYTTETIVDFFVGDGELVYNTTTTNDYGDNDSFGAVVLDGFDYIIEQATQGMITVETLSTMKDLYNIVRVANEKYAPFIKALKDAQEGKESVCLEDVLALFVEHTTSTEVTENGTTYNFDTAGLIEIADKLATEKIVDLIESSLGEGAVNEFITELKKLPDYTIEEIATSAIEIAQTYDFDVEYTYDIIENIIYKIAKQELDIEQLITSSYELSILDIIFDSMSPEMKEQMQIATKDDLSAMISATIDQYVTMLDITVDQLVGMVLASMPQAGPQGGMDEPQMPNPSPELVMEGSDQDGVQQGNVQQMPLLSEMIKGLLAQADQMLTVSVTVDEEGALVEMVVDFGGMLSLSYGEGVYTLTVNAVIPSEEGQMPCQAVIAYAVEDEQVVATIFAMVEDQMVEMYSATFAYTEQNGFNAIIDMADQILAELIAQLEKDEENTIFNGSFEGLGYKFDVDANKLTGTASVILSQLIMQDEQVEQAYAEMFKVDLVTEQDGTIVAVIYMAESEMARVNLALDKEYDFQTVIALNSPDMPLTVNVTVDSEGGVCSVIAEGLMMAGTDNEMAMFNATFEFIEIKEENSKIVRIDGYIEMMPMNGSSSEMQVLLDGVVEVLYSYSEDGKLETITFDVAIDKMPLGFGMGAVSVNPSIPGEAPSEPNDAIIYTQIYIEVVVDIANDKVLDKEEFEDAFNKLDNVRGFEFEKVETSYSNIDYLPRLVIISADYVQTEDEEYFIITETINDGNKSEIWTANVPAKNGLPVICSISANYACENWVYMYLDFSTIEGTRYVKIADQQVGEPYIQIRPLYLYVIYNYVTGETASSPEEIHDYEYISVGMCGESEVTITKTCKNCREVEIHYTQGCYRLLKETKTITTQCGEISVHKMECIVCGSIEIREGSFNKCYFVYLNDASTYLTEEQLESAGITVNGTFVSAYVNVCRCDVCGTMKYEYKYYTNENGVCKAYTKIVYEYDGIDGYYDAQKIEFSYVVDQCYSHSSLDYYWAENSSLISSYVAQCLGADFISEYFETVREDSCLVEYKCSQCGDVSLRCIYLADEQTQQYLQLDLNYSNGVFKSFRVDNTYLVKYTLDLVAKYYPSQQLPFDLQDVRDARIELWGDANREIVIAELYIYLSDNSSFELGYRVEDGSEIVVSYYYDYLNCKRTYEYYHAGILEGYSEGDDHAWDTVYSPTGSCCEDGREYYNVCYVCQKDSRGEYGKTEKDYYCHIKEYYTRDLRDAKAVTESVIDVDGYVTGWICYACGKVHDCEIGLHEDWVLTNDVYIYASQLRFELNGYNIDLNGYNLILYSIDGSQLTLTSSYTQRDENGELTNVDPVIGDSVGGGKLVMFTYYGNYGEYIYGDDGILVSHFVLDADYFISDTSYRDTIMQDYYEMYGEELRGFNPVFSAPISQPDKE